MYSDFIKTVQNNSGPMPVKPLRKAALAFIVVAQLLVGIALMLFAPSEAGSVNIEDVRLPGQKP